MGQNIFLETGFSDEDATVLALETDAAIAIARFVRSMFSGSQTAAAKHLHIGQNEVSAILNGNIARFSLARLIKIARRAGLRLYFDMGDDAHGAGVTTLVPTIVDVPVIVSEMNQVTTLLEGILGSEQLQSRSRATNRETKVTGAKH